jgi:hypothetical protein
LETNLRDILDRVDQISIEYPRTHVVRDNRTSVEIIESIASHGRTVDAALARLKALLTADSATATGD